MARKPQMPHLTAAVPAQDVFDALPLASRGQAHAVFGAIVQGTTASTESAGKPRGRPPTDGVKRGFVLVRALSMLKHYAAAHSAGVEHNAAIGQTVAAVKTEFPGMTGVNRTEVKRVLAEFQPEHRADVFRVRPHGAGGALFVGKRRSKRIKLD